MGAYFNFPVGAGEISTGLPLGFRFYYFPSHSSWHFAQSLPLRRLRESVVFYKNQSAVLFTYGK